MTPLEQCLIAEYLQRWAVSDNFSFRKGNCSRTKIKDQVKVMAGNHLGLSITFKPVDNGPAPQRIKAGTRFIENKNVRLHSQDSGYGNMPFFTAGEMVRGPVDQVERPNLRQCRLDSSLNLILRQAEVQRPKSHILAYRRHKKLIIDILKNHTDTTPDTGNGLFS